MNIDPEIGRKFDVALGASIARKDAQHGTPEDSWRYADACINSPEWLRVNLDVARYTLTSEILDVLVSALLLAPVLANAARRTRLVDSMDLASLLSPIEKLCAALHDIAYKGNDVGVEP